MTSDPRPPREAYVWIWLPQATAPVVAGRIAVEEGIHVFNYGRSYLDRADAIAIYAPELPLRRGAIEPAPPLKMANCLRDGGPDAWGRRVIINRLTGARGDAARDIEFDELTYLLESGSDRAGALDFQTSANRYTARQDNHASLADLLEAAGKVERGEPIPEALDRALLHGSSIGGARPKALIEDGDRTFIAKFSATNDTYAVVKAEFIAMRLAARAGLSVAPVELRSVSGKDVLLVERFDRIRTEQGWARKAMVSALTLFGLDELQAHYGSYSELADLVRARFTRPRETVRELFGRLVFNVLCGNTDDHARNHAAFWEGSELTLTPAYDICPQTRNGREANQSLLIDGDNRRSQLVGCLGAAGRFLLTEEEARRIIDAQLRLFRGAFDEVCAEAGLSQVDRAFLWRRQFLNEYALEGYPFGEAEPL